MSEAVGIGLMLEEDNASHETPAGRRSENRVVNRGSPRPRSYRAAPSFPVHVSARPRTGDAGAKTDSRAYEHGAARLRDESDPRRAPKGIAWVSVAALGNDEVRVLELERFRSANVDRTHRRSRRPRALPSAPRIRAT